MENLENLGQGGTIRDRLVDDLKLVIKDAEDLLRTTSSQASDGYQAAREKFESTLGTAKGHLTTLQGQFVDSSREALDTANDYVQRNPWQAIGIGAIAGIVAGVLIARR
jgi:ElaB/YqjD/DUF883 family membrane-anchored ribosome-binding protein